MMTKGIVNIWFHFGSFKFFFFFLNTAIVHFLTLLLAINRKCWWKLQRHCYHAGRSIVDCCCLSPKWEGNLLNSDPPLLTTDVVSLSLSLSCLISDLCIRRIEQRSLRGLSAPPSGFACSCPATCPPPSAGLQSQGSQLKKKTLGWD